MNIRYANKEDKFQVLKLLDELGEEVNKKMAESLPKKCSGLILNSF